MKKRVVSVLLAMVMTLSLAACGSKAEEPKKEEEVKQEETKETENKLVPEDDEIVWAQGLSGNAFVTIANKFGYFEELGLNVKEIPLDAGQLQGVVDGQVDIASNSGTNGPLQMIAAGDDMAIIGGFMLEGCMPIIAKEGVVWNGPTDFVGKKVGGSPTTYAITHHIAEAGYDLNEDIEWVPFDNDADKIAAILNGEIDYAIMGTGRMYMCKNTDGIAILSYCDDETPNYSCCRMVARKSWVEENPNTVKLLDQALLRAQSYFETHREEVAKMMAEQLNADLEYVEAYMMEEEHYEINVATVKKTVIDNWHFLREQGLIPDLDDSVIEEATYNDLYKEALDAGYEAYYDENPEFWDRMQAFYDELQ